MSNTITEWVSAPTEMKSTPVSATSRARSRVRPPEASSVASAVGDRHRLGHLLVGHVVEQDPLAAGVEQLAQLVEVGHLDLDGDVRVGGADRLERRHDAPGREDVVVLDHGHVAEPEAVVDPAAAAHGVLLQRTPVRQRLAGVEHARLGALERLDPAGGRGGDAGQVRGEVEGGALGGEQPARRSGDPHDGRRPRRRGCRRAPGRSPRPRRRGRRRRPAPRRRGRRPPRPRGRRSRRSPAASAGMVAALVMSSAPPGRSSSSAPTMAAYTACGSSPASDSSSSRSPGRSSYAVKLMRPPRPTAAAGVNATAMPSSSRRTSKWPDQRRVVAVREVLAPVRATGLLADAGRTRRAPC